MTLPIGYFRIKEPDSPSLTSHASATKSKNEKNCIIGESHLKENNNKKLVKNWVKFKDLK